MLQLLSSPSFKFFRKATLALGVIASISAIILGYFMDLSTRNLFFDMAFYCVISTSLFGIFTYKQK